jgi:hypothetical protein
MLSSRTSTKRSKMKTINQNIKTRGCSRRHFLAAAGLTAAAVGFMPRRLFGDEVIEPVETGESKVSIIRRAAADAKINVTKLRNNISVLEGSGGNIAVLTGPDGKLLIEAGITTSRARISEALAGLSPDPITHLSDGDFGGLILVGGFGRFLQLAAIAVGITGDPVFGFCSFVYACHTGENKSENKKFKKNQIKSRKSLRFNGRNLVHINEGSIPFTRSMFTGFFLAAAAFARLNCLSTV